MSTSFYMPLTHLSLDATNKLYLDVSVYLHEGEKLVPDPGNPELIGTTFIVRYTIGAGTATSNYVDFDSLELPWNGRLCNVETIVTYVEDGVTKSRTSSDSSDRAEPAAG